MSTENKVLGIIGIVTAILVFGGVFFLSKNNTSAPSASNSGTTSTSMATLTANAAHSITFSDAKVTITEFADYQCPACAMYNPEIEKIKQEYNGKVNFYFRHFPLPMHGFARTAAKAAEAAGEQGKFWEMNTLLFSRQDTWSKGAPTESFINYAKELGLDEKAFTEMLNSSKYDGRIEQDIKDGEAAGVDSTPTVFINDKKMTQAPTATNLRKEIDSILNQ